MLGGPADPAVELVRRCAAGDPRAWDEFVARYSRLVHSIPRRYGLSASDSEDVMQAVFIAAFRSLERIDDPSRIASWLITSAHRETWRIGRERHTVAESTEFSAQFADVGAPPADSAETWERQDRVDRALAELGGSCEELLRSLYSRHGEPDYQALSARLGMPVGSIGPTRARCLRKLERLLRAAGFQAGLDEAVEAGSERGGESRPETAPGTSGRGNSTGSSLTRGNAWGGSETG